MTQYRKVQIPYFHVYTLELCDGKYYVGLSRGIKRRFIEHKSGEGAKWTKQYAPIRIIEDYQTCYCSYNHLPWYRWDILRRKRNLQTVLSRREFITCNARLKL